MKNLGTFVAATFLAIVLGLYMCTFQVRYTEVAIIKTLNKPAKEPITKAALYFKWPRPIQTVVRYDKRIRILEDRTEETRTSDGKNVILTTFTLWRIVDPLRFHMNFPEGVADGEKKLRTTIATHKQAVVGQRTFGDFVSTDPETRKVRVIEREIQDAVAEDAARAEYGIEVVDFGIKKLALPQSVTTAIFESMKSHEEAKAQRYTAEGEARANDILAGAHASRDRIMAEVHGKVSRIQNEAEQVVSQYYEKFKEYPELRIFLDRLATVLQALRSRTTLILDTSESPFNVFDADERARVPSENSRFAPDATGSATNPRP